MDDRYGPKRSENYRTKRLAASGRTETVELTRSELDRRAQLDQERSVAAAAMMITLGRSRLMRTFQSPLSCMLILTLALAAATVAGQGAPSPKAVPLFDSKTLDGWEGNLKIFRVEDGAIVAGTLDNEIARNEFLCTTRTFGDFELRLKVKLLGGEAFSTHRYVYWNFVSSSRERIEQAKEDWQAGRFPLVPGDDQEFIPLPERPKTVSYP